MPRKPQTSYTNFQKVLPQISGDAASASARAMQGVGNSVKRAGDMAISWQTQMEQIEGRKRESEMRNQWAADYADVRNQMMETQDPDARRQLWTERLEEMKASDGFSNLSDASRDRMEVDFNNFATKTMIEVERDAALLRINNTRAAILGETKRDFMEGNYDSGISRLEENSDVIPSDVYESYKTDAFTRKRNDEFNGRMLEDPDQFIKDLGDGTIKVDPVTRFELENKAMRMKSKDVSNKIDKFNNRLAQMELDGNTPTQDYVVQAAKELGLDPTVIVKYRDTFQEGMSADDILQVNSDIVRVSRQIATGDYGLEDQDALLAKRQELSLLVNKLPSELRSDARKTLSATEQEWNTGVRRLQADGQREIENFIGIESMIPEKGKDEKDGDYTKRQTYAKDLMFDFYERKTQEILSSGVNPDSLTPDMVFTAIIQDKKMRNQARSKGIKLDKVGSYSHLSEGGLLPPKQASSLIK